MSTPAERAGERIRELELAITSLEAQRESLGAAAFEVAVAALRRELGELRDAGRPGPTAAPTLSTSPEAERRRVTVMFADLSGFTALAEGMDPEQARALINDCFEQLVPVVERYGGTVDKFVGDAVVALFGAPVAHENDPERALRAALEMRDALAVFNTERGTDLGLHFGINTGPVVAGGVGSTNRQEYSVIGHPVNLAARLEDASARGEIFVGPDTHRATAPLFDFDELPAMTLKGTSAPLRIHRLLGCKAAPGAVRGIVGLRSPLVGRAAELKQLADAVTGVSDGRGTVVAVVGEAGLGKSRLVAEARASLPARVRWEEGRALSHTRGMSYWMARDLFRALLGLPRESPPEVLGLRLREDVAQRLPDRAAAVLPYLLRLLDAPLDEAGEEQLADLTAEALQRRILASATAYIEARAAEAPLVLVWEDLHWADPSSLTLLERLLPSTLRAPLLLVLAYRADEGSASEVAHRGAAEIGDRWKTISLAPLGSVDSARLLDNLIAVEGLSPEGRERILSKAEGNAFFLEEVLRSLIDDGVLAVREGRAVAVRSLGAIQVPDTLEGVVMARVDRLAPMPKRTLQTAAVLGRVFASDLLARLANWNDGGDGRGWMSRDGGKREGANGGKGSLEGALEDLLVRELIRPHGALAGNGEVSSSHEYIFKHAVTHEVAYQSLLVARRRELHGRAAELIERLWPERHDAHAATLGHHFRLAGVRDKAIRYLVRAAELARATYANVEAVDFTRAALELVEPLAAGDRETGGNVPGAIDARLPLSPELEARTWRELALRLEESLGDVLELSGHREEARAAYESARARVPEMDRLTRSRLHRKEARAWEGQGRSEEALRSYAVAEEVLGGVPTNGDLRTWEEWLQIRLDRMWVYYFLADLERLSTEIAGLRLAVERRGTPAQRCLFFQRVVLLAFRRDRYVISDETFADARRALAAAGEADDPPLLGHCHFSLGLCHCCRVELEQARAFLGSALAIGERIGDATLLTRCHTYLTVVHRRGGDLEATREGVANTLAAAGLGRMVEYVAMARANEAWLAWREGRSSEAEGRGREALDLWAKSWAAYPFKWAAVWPLIAVMLTGDRASDAVGFARILLEPAQQPMPRALAVAVSDSIAAGDVRDLVAARAHLERAARLARDERYL